MTLFSHPDKLLAEHINEVSSAAKVIAARHHWNDPTDVLLDTLIQLHDFGKATAFFQDYITCQPSPAAWTGRTEDKAHTLLGLFAATYLKRTEQFPDSWLLQLGTSILGHHSYLPTRDDIDKRLHNGAGVLIRQLNTVPLQELRHLTGFEFPSELQTTSENSIFEVMDTWDELFDWLDTLTLSETILQRLKTQQLFSVLLEADKAFLALSQEAQGHYTQRNFFRISPDVVDQFLDGVPDSPVNLLRTQARVETLQHIKASPGNLLTLTLPTGLGKTLTAASLALTLRERQARKVIIVLPFLAIVDQTAKVYAGFLGQPSENILMQSHSLSVRDYLELEDGDADFLLDTWQSDFIITTFDQVLLALFSSRAKHQMRFHNLCSSIVIFDEIQALPTHLWDITQQALKSLSTNFGSTIIAMSATQPGFMGDAYELIRDVPGMFRHFGRYQLILKHHTDTSIGDFIHQITARFNELKSRRLLITVNTRSSARRIYDDLRPVWTNEDISVFFLTADVTPVDRLSIIDQLKDNPQEPCLVVSTQVVEAGVDIDMDLVMRDFAPLDSLIQVAGRCNRNNLKPRCNVEIYSLVNDKGKRYSAMVYRKLDGSADISLQETRKVLEDATTIQEEDALTFSEKYFAAIRALDDLGQQTTSDWAYFKNHLPVSKLLRGDQDNQYQFVVAERDREATDLELAVTSAVGIQDRWEKRRVLRRLASRLALVTVTVWGKKGFDPANVAYPVGPFWFVHKGFYDDKRGLDLGVGSSDDSSFL